MRALLSRPALALTAEVAMALASSVNVAGASNPNLLLDLDWMSRATLADVQAEIEGGADDMTPLHFAAKFNLDPAMVRTPVNAGADIEAVAMEGEYMTPLHLAVCYSDNLQVV